jgi:N-acetyl-gamma-glutamyl-phosphate reductase common form
MGGEALRVLLEHPSVEIAWATSRREEPIEAFHPNLYGCGIRTIHPDRIGACDVVFNALPGDPALEATPGLLDLGCRVIDLGSSFRLRDRETWERVYGRVHPCWPLAERAVYGIPELHAEAIAAAELIANPGCFSSAAILALAPLVREGLVDLRSIVVDGLSGTAGAGAALARPIHHPEIAGNLLPYNVVDHRHTYEMEQELGLLADGPVSVHFTPVYVPISRGILNLCHVFPERALDRSRLLELYRDFYADAPFTTVYDRPKQSGATWQYAPYPWVSSVAGTNHCLIGLDVDPRRNRVLVMAVLDSVGKGGAHAAVENMNLMFGLPRSLGLERRGLHP